MARPKVFVGSSSEGLRAAQRIRHLLMEELDLGADVQLWKRAFELSSVTIEALEKGADRSDFAVLVLTADDVTTSRRRAKPVPRDNVVFELGLFIGRLGRERCYLVEEDKPKLKLPTDLLGVTSTRFQRPVEEGGWDDALRPAAFLIGERIAKLGPSYKFSPAALAAQAAMRSFCDRVKGAWWERVTGGGRNAISYLQIEPEDASCSVRLEGRVYNLQGRLDAHWTSLVSRVLKDEKKILYYWQGWHTKSANEPFHGVGDMEFEGSAASTDLVSRGRGKYWDVNESHPESTVIRPVELHRVDPNEMSTMIAGKTRAVRSLVLKKLKDW